MRTFNLIAGLYAIVSAPFAALGAEPLTLTFIRTGPDAASVSVNADVSGVTATLTNVSHSFKSVGTTTLCPDVNGSSGPTIVFNFSLTNLPAGWSFNNVGLDIRALNSSGDNQMNNDGKKRQFNISVTSGSTSLVSYKDLDPAAGIAGVRKVWNAQTAATVIPSNPYELTITITKGTANEGCFFGLEAITLSTTEGEGETPTPPALTNKFYTIKWKNNTSSYITEQPNGTLAIGDYATHNRIFWEVIPTEKEDCYYIRSVASGNYIGSCNMAPSSASLVKMSAIPVEYYVHISAATEGENRGCYWLSSTDCENYANESAGTRCLNKDGASSNIIVWTSGVANKGSYWTLTETANLYEVHPFTPGQEYFIRNAGGQSLNHSFAWTAFDPKADNARWKFDGVSNSSSASGYLIINALTNEPINNGARYKVENANGLASYRFICEDGSHLSLGGEQTFSFIAARSTLALNHQLYQMPCGSIGDTWISQVIIGSDYRYPMATKNDGTLVNGTVTSKPTKYNILTRDAATVAPDSEANVRVALNKEPAADYSLQLFVDWDRDGLFEYSQTLASKQEQDFVLSVPVDAKPGRTRLRFRLNSNGLTGADDDVNGEVLDLLLNVSNNMATPVAPVVDVNDPLRGFAEWSNGYATATVKGNALFLYWAEGHRITSVDSRYEIAASTTPRVITAYFTANTDKLDGINSTRLNSVDSTSKIVVNDGIMTVAGADAEAIIIFNLSGHEVASSVKSVDVNGLSSGIHIAKAVTAAGIVSAKILL